MPDYPGVQFLNKRQVSTQGRLFVIGDSFSTIRRTGSTNAVNGRFNNSSGWNFWDWFRFGFPVPLPMDITTNFAREGAIAARDWTTTAPWSDINPIPGMASQVTSLIAANPVGMITASDICGIAIGLNDNNPVAGANASDGATKPTPAQTETAILVGIDRLIIHGFKNFIIWYPPSKYQPTLPGLMQPDIDTRVNTNRDIKFVTAFMDSAMLEQTDPTLDGTHPNESASKRLGEIGVSNWKSVAWVDRTQSLLVSTLGSSVSNVREMGFNNFDPNVNKVRLRLVDAFNCFEAETNKQMSLRGYNGLYLAGAFEGNAPVVPAGGGKSDPCVTIAGNFWEHNAILRLENIAGSPAPLLLGRLGGVDKIKIAASGAMTIDTPDTNMISAIGRGAFSRFVVDNGQAVNSNTGVELRNNGLSSWVLASYGPSTNNYGFVFYNTQTSTGDPNSLFIKASNNFVGIGTASPLVKLDVVGGGIGVGGQQVMGARIAGWSQTQTGGSRAAVTTGSTTAAVAAALIQLITDLKTHGMLGT